MRAACAQAEFFVQALLEGLEPPTRKQVIEFIKMLVLKMCLGQMSLLARLFCLEATDMAATTTSCQTRDAFLGPPKCSLHIFFQSAKPFVLLHCIAVPSNLCTAIHRDFNTVDYPNLLCPISEVAGGALWCESSDGSVVRVHQDKCLRGELPDASKGPVLLPVKSSFHCTEPWSGHRQILVAYAGTDVPRLCNAAVQFLLDLGLLVAGLWSCGLPIVPSDAQQRFASGLPLSYIALLPLAGVSSEG